jgi:hypothetical protein
MLLLKEKETLPAFAGENLNDQQKYKPLVLPLVRLGFSTLGRLLPKKAAEIA